MRRELAMALTIGGLIGISSCASQPATSPVASTTGQPSALLTTTTSQPTVEDAVVFRASAWWSDDAVTWSLADIEAPDGGRSEMNAVTVYGDIAIAVGEKMTMDRYGHLLPAAFEDLADRLDSVFSSAAAASARPAAVVELPTTVTT